MFSLLVDWFENLLFINLKRVFLDFLADFRILRENLFMHKLLCKSEALNILDKSHIDELTFALIDNIMIADNLRP